MSSQEVGDLIKTKIQVNVIRGNLLCEEKNSVSNKAVITEEAVPFEDSRPLLKLLNTGKSRKYK